MHCLNHRVNKFLVRSWQGVYLHITKVGTLYIYASIENYFNNQTYMNIFMKMCMEHWGRESLYTTWKSWTIICHVFAIDLIHKSQNAPVPYPTMLHSEQKCAHFCSKWSIVGYGPGTFWDLWNWSIDMLEYVAEIKWPPFRRRHFKRIFLNENSRIALKISRSLSLRGAPINNIPAPVQITAWHRPGATPLSKPMMVRLPMHICLTRPQWVNPGHQVPYPRTANVCFCVIWCKNGKVYSKFILNWHCMCIHLAPYANKNLVFL